MTKFNKTPLTKVEKEKLSNKFIKGSENKSEKQKIRPLYLRAPDTLMSDIQEIMTITGLSMNAICLEILRPAIKRKLREIKEE